ncbi:hypothetical protein ACN38_g7857 [Penicillium nordicum]|uniref:Uncharacterized protein n=1 Tax=Penicillium nordicum TaxID=229535 RepID=A0A0M9WE00_9EURO|nr:hypothetical protein ACN38_g7857 [Penicillium nordicum]
MSFYFGIHTGISERISGTVVNRFRGQTESYLFETLVSSLSVKSLAAMGLCLDGGGGDVKECFCLRTCCDRLMDLWLE